jgi:hypothetical protein
MAWTEIARYEGVIALSSFYQDHEIVGIDTV